MTVGEQPISLLRFLTAGSVDDGKSTLIGRLLYESQGIYEDQLAAVNKFSSNKGGELDLSLITDGLRAEREQAITIDVAYRYFSTEKRKFIIADTPGHEQYTRNMVTGASTADLALVLVDSRKGVLEQTLRHTYIAWLLGIRTVIVAVNKMDLVNFDSATFFTIKQQYLASAKYLGIPHQHFVPISALHGDNVVRRSSRMDWYHDATLLELLETIQTCTPNDTQPLRFPIQAVIRPNQDYRGYAGQLASGKLRRGDEVIALPSKRQTHVKEICVYHKVLDKAASPMSIVVSISDHVDLGRGDMLVGPDNVPALTTRIVAKLIWMSESSLRQNSPYLIKHTSQVLCGTMRLVDKVDVNTFEDVQTDRLNLNEIGTVQIETHRMLFVDPYLSNRTTGSFIVIDPLNSHTVAAGIIIAAAQEGFEERLQHVPSSEQRKNQRGLTVWFTGLSGAGKSAIAGCVCTELLARGLKVELLDGDVIRKHIGCDLGFSKKDRDENIRRIGYIADLLTRHGVIVLVAAISPYREARAEVRKKIGRFLEIFVNAPLEICERRDQKGLYRRARAGEIQSFTGINDPYEHPLAPDLCCNTHEENLQECTNKVLKVIRASYCGL